jgi:coenzyme F420 hydrogenase subunit beta
MKTFIGYAKDRRIREIGSSGGVITSLLIYLMKKRIIDGAVVCRMDGLDARLFIAKDEREIIESAQSKYVDLDLKEIIKEVKSYKGKLAVVGVPCQLKIFKRLREFNKKVVYWFGLYCGCGLKKEGIRALLRKMGVKEEDIKRVEYRAGKGYGGFKVTLRNGKTKFVSKDAFNYLFTLYMPEKCLPCRDFFNEYSDISFGDCWFKKKHTSILVRNEKGIDLLKRADNIVIQEIDKKRFFAQHSHSVRLKKKRLNLKRYKFFIEKVPLWVLEKGAKIMKILKK